MVIRPVVVGPYSFRWAAVAVGPREEEAEVDLAGSAAEAEVSAEAAQDQIGSRDANEGISQQARSLPDYARDSECGIENFRRNTRFHPAGKIQWQPTERCAEEI